MHRPVEPQVTALFGFVFFTDGGLSHHGHEVVLWLVAALVLFPAGFPVHCCHLIFRRSGTFALTCVRPHSFVCERHPFRRSHPGERLYFQAASAIRLSEELFPDYTLTVGENRGCFLLCNYLGVGPFLRVTG